MNITFLFVGLFFGATLNAHEYLYPIDVDGTAQHILLMHQYGDKQVQLFLWDRQSHAVAQVLSTQYQPTGVRMLPDGAAFSFIEEDILKVKEFNKRSSQLILFDEPIYGLTVVSWIDAQTYYFSAQDEGRFGVYQGTRQGVVDPIVADSQHDYLYPQKIDETLFCVRRTDSSSQIISLAYPKLNSIFSAEDETKIASRIVRIEQDNYGAHTTKTPVVLLYDAHEAPVIFLHMVSAVRGFYMSHERTISPLKMLTCSYHEIMYDKVIMQWREKKLFNFDIPYNMVQVTNKEALVETIYPYVPRYEAQCVWYCSFENNRWHVMKYDCTHLTASVVYQAETPLMRPTVWKNTLQIGRTVTSTQPLYETITRSGQQFLALQLTEVTL